MASKCQALKCDIVVGPGWAFCTMHWKALDDPIREELSLAYTSGQKADITKKSGRWHRAVNRARAVFKERKKDE